MKHAAIAQKKRVSELFLYVQNLGVLASVVISKQSQRIFQLACLFAKCQQCAFEVIEPVTARANQRRKRLSSPGSVEQPFARSFDANELTLAHDFETAGMRQARVRASLPHAIELGPVTGLIDLAQSFERRNQISSRQLVRLMPFYWAPRGHVRGCISTQAVRLSFPGQSCSDMLSIWERNHSPAVHC